jgi:hypothetical protein
MSLFVVCELKEKSVELEELRKAVGPTDKDGTHDFAQLASAATQFGLYPLGAHVDRPALRNLPMPVIVQTRQRANKPPWQPAPHAMILLGTDDTGVQLVDPPGRPFHARWAVFEANWTGNVLAFADDAAGQEQLRSWLSGWRLPNVLWWLVLIACLVSIGFWLIRTGGRTAVTLAKNMSSPIKGLARGFGEGRFRTVRYRLAGIGLLCCLIAAIVLVLYYRTAGPGEPRLAIASQPQALVSLEKPSLRIKGPDTQAFFSMYQI